VGDPRSTRSTRSDEIEPLRARAVESATASVVAWTFVSRLTGLLRVAAVGATLGSTFFANIFQATNTVPNVMYNLMAGSLLVSIIVPSLVEALEREGLEGARRLCRALCGAITLGFGAVAILVVLLGPVLVSLITLGVRGTDQASDARGQAWVLLLLVIPQVVLYGFAAVGAAAQNARGRFALAAAAPAAENVGLIVTLLLVARWFGTGHDVGSVSTGQLALLGVGSTVSVLLHAGLQMIGARRVGLPIWPGWGLRTTTVQTVLHRLVPMAGTAMLEAGLYFALVLAAGTVAGGVIAFQIGLHFYNLPLALGSRAIGTVLLPQLAREIVQDRRAAFLHTYTQGLSRAWFLALPASVALVAFAHPIAEAVAFGALNHAEGVELLTLAIGSFGAAVTAGATYEIARQATYARYDVRSPAFGALVQFVVVIGGAIIGVVAFDGQTTVLSLGLAFAAGMLASAVVVDRAARRGLRSAVDARTRRSLVRHAVVAMVAVVPASVLARVVSTAVEGKPGAISGVVLGSMAGLAGYVALQSLLRAPELALLPTRRPDATRRSAAEGTAA
jgi:putative peptidoglycan lipid II flippase